MKNCSICKKRSAEVYRSNVKSVYSRKAYDVLHCSNCEHYFTDPTFTQKELNEIYKNKYSYDAHYLIRAEKRMRARKYADYISKLNVLSVLEIGCMHGLLLSELKQKGLKVSGVELDRDAVNYCHKQGLNVVQSSTEDYLKKANDKNEVIIMSHVIEHIVDPTKQLKELRKRMSKTGRLVLIAPNSKSFTRRLFGRYWGYWQVPVHINHFNNGSIKKLLDSSGFNLLEIRYYGGDSLFFLSTFANILGANNETKTLSTPKKFLVKISTIVLRPWYFLGSEDMLIVAERTKG